MSEKMEGVGLQDLLPRFTCTDAADVLWSYDYEKRSYRSC